MTKDISKALHEFVKGLYAHRNDLTIQVARSIKNHKPFYSVHFLVHIEPTDGLYATINKGIDKFFLKNEILSYFNLSPYDFSITYQNVYSGTIY